MKGQQIWENAGRGLDDVSPAEWDVASQTVRGEVATGEAAAALLSSAPSQPNGADERDAYIGWAEGEIDARGIDFTYDEWCLTRKAWHACLACKQDSAPAPSASPAALTVPAKYKELWRQLRAGMSNHHRRAVELGFDGISDAIEAHAPAASPAAPQPSYSALLERDSSKPAEQQGLFRKFDVRRADGSDSPGGKHHGCEYFVLDVTHDEHAAAALRAYGQSCATTHPQLAADLRNRFGAAPLPNEGVAWHEAERVADLPAVHEALQGFSENATGDNGTCVVRAVLEATHTEPDPCPHCIAGGFCKKPSCGRLAVLNIATQLAGARAKGATQ